MATILFNTYFVVAYIVGIYAAFVLSKSDKKSPSFTVNFFAAFTVGIIWPVVVIYILTYILFPSNDG